MRLTGKTALVTGAGAMRNIGHAIAYRLAEEGADIVISDIEKAHDERTREELEAGWKGLASVEERIEGLGRECLSVHCDITSPDDVEDLVARATEKFNTIDILINSARAPLGDDRVPLVDIPEHAWDRVFTVNARGPMTCSKLVARHMIQKGNPGRIINISSSAATSPRPGAAAYAASKAALNVLTFAMARELAEHDILVTAVCPGTVDTGRVAAGDYKQAEAAGLSFEDWRAQQKDERSKEVPLGRIATPEDVAGVVAFLASGDASYVTGEAINVTGGRVLG